MQQTPKWLFWSCREIVLPSVPVMLHSVEAMSLFSANVRSLENCIDKAMYNIFGFCDTSTSVYVNIAFGKVIAQNKVTCKHVC